MSKTKYSEYSMGFDVAFKGYSTTDSLTIYFRSQPNFNDSYALTLGTNLYTGKDISIKKCIASPSTKTEIGFNDTVKLTTGTKYRVMVTVTGTTTVNMTVYINGAIVAQATDSTSPYIEGGVMFKQYVSSVNASKYAMIDNFKMTDPQTVTGTVGNSIPVYPSTTDFDDVSSAASSSVASSSAASSSATSSLGVTGLEDITMGKTQNALLSENFDDSDNVNSAFNDMILAGCTVADGKFNNAAVPTTMGNGNKDRVYTTSAINFSDYIFETDVTVSKDYTSGWLFSAFYFRTSTYTSTSGALEGDFYSLTIGTYEPAKGMQVWVGKRKAGVNTYLVGTDAKVGIPLAPEAGVTATTRSYHLKVIVSGTSLKAYIGETLIADATLDGEYTSGGLGFASTNFALSLDNINVYNPITLSAATFDLGSDFANRKVELHSDVMTGTTNAQGLVTFTNIAAGDHQLIVYDAAGTNVAYTVNLFLAEGTALEAGGNGVNMTSAGATITLQLVGGQLVITGATAGTGTITSQGTSATGDTTNVWMLIAIMALAAGAVFTVKKIEV